MSRYSGALSAVALFLVLLAPSARANTLFLGAPIDEFDINVTNVDTKYVIFNKTTGIGEFIATGTPQYKTAPTAANMITGGSFTVHAFFDLASGNVRFSDSGNMIKLDGMLGAGPMETFFLSAGSTALKKFGSGPEDTFDFVFANNAGTLKPGSDIMSRIMGVRIPDFSDPTFKYVVQPTDVNNQVIWDNTPIGGVEPGVANVFAPAPKGATGLCVLLLGFGAYLTLRRQTSQGWRQA